MLIDLYVVAPSNHDDLKRLLDSCINAGLDGVCLLGREESFPITAVGDEASNLKLFFGVEFALDRGRLAWIPTDAGVLSTSWREHLGPQPTIEGVFALADELGGAIIVAHPYDRFSGPCFADGVFHLPAISAIQVANAALASERNHLALEAAQRLRTSAIGGTGPGSNHVGRAATAFLFPVSDQATLVEAIERGDVWAVELLDRIPRDENQNRTQQQRRRTDRSRRQNGQGQEGAVK